MRLIYNPSNKAIYVANYGSQDISLISSATNNVIKTINVGSGIGTGPQFLEYNPSNGYIYAVKGSLSPDGVSVISGSVVL